MGTLFLESDVSATFHELHLFIFRACGGSSVRSEHHTHTIRHIYASEKHRATFGVVFPNMMNAGSVLISTSFRGSLAAKCSSVF